MSITSRINEMSSHIEQAYDELQGLGADLTNVNKNIENISMVLDDIYDSMPQVSDEGTSLTLEDTRVGKIKSTLKGNTSQDGTPTPSSPIPVNVVSGDNTIGIVGKNYYPMPSSATKNGITYTLNDNGTFNISGTATATADFFNSVNIEEANIINGETYTLYFNALLNFYGMVAFYNGDTWLSTPLTISPNARINSATLTIPSNCNKINFVIRVGNGVTVNQNNAYCMLVKGSYTSSNLPSFEPYQGNTYNIDLPVENLFDKSTATLNKGVSSSTGNLYNNSDSFVTDYIPIQNEKSYTMNSYSSSNVCFGALYDSSKAFLEGFTTSQNNKTVTINNANAKYIRITGQKVNIDTYQLEKGPKANSYTPYGTTPIELCKIGNYQDYFYKDSGKWYLHKETHKHTVTGVENWSMTYGEGLFNCGYESFMPTKKPNSPIAYSNYFVFDNRESGMSSLGDNKFAIQGNYTGLFFRNNGITSASDFKTWLSTHNTNIYYVLATPTNTELTYEPLIDQLNLLEKAMSKDGQTNISQVNNDLPFIISASALKEWSE